MAVQVSSLNMSIGVVAALFVTAAGSMWTVAGWANDIEDNIESNQEHIEVLAQKVDDYAENQEERDKARAVRDAQASVLQVQLIEKLTTIIEQNEGP